MIYSLSKNYKDYLFILRFKNTNFFDDKIFSKALKIKMLTIFFLR